MSRTAKNNSPVVGLRRAAVCAVLLALLAVWSWWPSVAKMSDRWLSDPLYQFAFAVPVAAALIAWIRRRRVQFSNLALDPRGLIFVGLAIGLRLLALSLGSDYLDGLASVLCLFGVAAICGGGPALKWLWAPILFLSFMIPLPFGMEAKLAGPLTETTAFGTTYLLQTFAQPAVSSDGLVFVGNATLNVKEACGGLRALMLFFAVAAAISLAIKRPLWQRIFVFASAVPIAIFCNVLRLTVAGLMYNTSGAVGSSFLLNGGGTWLMVALALGLVFFELCLLHWLIIPPELVPVAQGSALKSAMPTVISNQPAGLQGEGGA